MLRIIVGRLPSKNIQAKTRRILEVKVYHTVPVRCYSKEICPPPKQPKKGSTGSGAIYTIGTLALLGGATLAYAKYDDDFRRTLVQYVPYSDDAIRFMFQEDQSFLVYTSNLYEWIKRTLSELLFSEKKRKERILEAPQDYKAPCAVISSLEDTTKPAENYTEIRLDQKESVEIVGDQKPSDKSECLPETHPSNLAELEEQILQAATEAVNTYNRAVYDLKVYVQELDSIIDESINKVQPQTWEAVKRKTEAKNETIKQAQCKAEHAAKTVVKLQSLLNKPNFEASPATREMVRMNTEKVQADIAKAQQHFECQQRLSSAAERYWDKVQKARQHYCEELECLFPAIDLRNKKLDVQESDLDLFLLHAYANVLFYQKELAKLETVGRERLQLAVEAARRGGGEALDQAQICEVLDEEKRRLTLCFQQQCMKLRQEAEHDLREQLKRQSQVFTDHLDEVVKLRSLEIERSLTRQFDEELEKERLQYKKQLAAMIGRLKGIDEALRVRDSADKASKQSQVLWSACQALLRAIKTGCPGVPWKDQLRPLTPEISLVKKAAAQGDQLVEAVLEGIPKEAKERGVFPEDALRERFFKVEQVARTVAMVPEEGAALPLHVVSYIQSVFLIKSPTPIPVAELNDEAVDVSRLNTHEILQRARYWVDRGDFAQTLKYMNLLEGAPRAVARQWMNEARILLETQQAANTLMAHAASSGLLHL